MKFMVTLCGTSLLVMDGWFAGSAKSCWGLTTPLEEGCMENLKFCCRLSVVGSDFMSSRLLLTIDRNSTAYSPGECCGSRAAAFMTLITSLTRSKTRCGSEMNFLNSGLSS